MIAIKRARYLFRRCSFLNITISIILSNAAMCIVYVVISTPKSIGDPANTRNNPYPSIEVQPKDSLNFDMNGLIERIQTDLDHSKSDLFTSERIRRLWPQWMEGIQTYKSWIETDQPNISGQPNSLLNRTRQNILIHLGLLTLRPTIGIEESIGKGGPLGELVQWTDLMTALYILGHNLMVSKDAKFTRQLIKNMEDKAKLDLIYTDIRGYIQIRSYLPESLVCKVRLLDSFGTESQYNRGPKRGFTGLKLNLKQFYTFFPHSPDNTFLGFVIENSTVVEPQFIIAPSNKPIALIAGKVVKMWQNATDYLKILSEYFEIHGNVADGDSENLPSFVINHKFNYGSEYMGLLKSAKVLVGLGFPYEGPAPLEAIANGVIFLNMRFNPPHKRNRTKFFDDKPTDRELTSQHPYIERYIGEPYSYVIDKNDEIGTRRTIKRLLDNPINSGFIPFELTTTGYLERINALVEHQNFCSTTNQLLASWPPVKSSLYILLAPAGQSCAVACYEPNQSDILQRPQEIIDQTRSEYLEKRAKHVVLAPGAPDTSHLYCASEHFPLVDSIAFHLLNVSEKNIISYSAAPYIDNSKQHSWILSETDNLWYDCMADGRSSTGQLVRRLCPCKDALPGQVEICRNCI